MKQIIKIFIICLLGTIIKAMDQNGCCAACKASILDYVYVVSPVTYKDEQLFRKVKVDQESAKQDYSKIKIEQNLKSNNTVDNLDIQDQESYFQKAYGKISDTVDHGVGKILQYPRASAALASLAAVGTFSYYYKTDEKFRKKIKKGAEHYYYKFLEEMFYLKAKWRDFCNKKLMTSHLAYAGILCGLGYKAKKFNDENQTLSKVSAFLKENSYSALTRLTEFISDKDNRNNFKNISYGILAGSFLIYLFKKVNEPVFQYQEIYNNFVKSLTQEQIDKIGLVNILQTDDNPELLKQKEIYAHLNSDQKKQITKIIAEFENQKKKFESQD